MFDKLLGGIDPKELNEMGSGILLQQAVKISEDHAQTKEDLDQASIDGIQNFINNLRMTADYLEANPHKLVGMMCNIVTLKPENPGDNEGIADLQMVYGTAPFIALAYLKLQAHGQEALETVMKKIVGSTGLLGKMFSKTPNFGSQFKG